jgi:hypothetical protein
MDIARLFLHGGDPLPHPALEDLPYRAYPIQFLSCDRRLRGCLATMCGWVTVDPPQLQSPLLELREEDGGEVLVCDKLVIHRPPLQVCAVAIWSPTDAGAVRRHIEWLKPTGPIDPKVMRLAAGWLNAALGSELGLPLGRRADPHNVWTRWGLAQHTREAMVARFKDGTSVTQEVIAEALELSRSRFAELLQIYGMSYRDLRREAEILATWSRLELAEAIRQLMVTRLRAEHPVTREVIAEAFHLQPSSLIPLLATYGLSYQRLLREAEALAAPPDSPDTLRL